MSVGVRVILVGTFLAIFAICLYPVNPKLRICSGKELTKLTEGAFGGSVSNPDGGIADSSSDADGYDSEAERQAIQQEGM